MNKGLGGLAESPRQVFIRIFDLSPAKLGRNLLNKKDLNNGVIISDTKPVLGIYVPSSELEFKTMDSMLHIINTILVKEKSEKVTSSLINQLRSPHLRLEVSSELVCGRGKPRQSLLSRRILQNDTDVTAIEARLSALWANAHSTYTTTEDPEMVNVKTTENSDDNEKLNHSTTTPNVSERLKSVKSTIYQLALPNLPLKIHQAEHDIAYIALSIYISNEGEPVAVPEDTLDPLSKAVHTISAVPSRNELCLRDGPALWLSRLDPRALQRYAVELTDNLASSITAAFESPEI